MRTRLQREEEETNVPVIRPLSFLLTSTVLPLVSFHLFLLSLFITCQTVSITRFCSMSYFVCPAVNKQRLNMFEWPNTRKCAGPSPPLSQKHQRGLRARTNLCCANSAIPSPCDMTDLPVSSVRLVMKGSAIISSGSFPAAAVDVLMSQRVEQVPRQRRSASGTNVVQDSRRETL